MAHMLLHVARLGIVGVAALLIAHRDSPAAIAINAFWLLLMLFIALTGAAAFSRPALGRVVAEGAVVVVAVQVLWSVAFTGGAPPRPNVGERSGAGWVVSFTHADQALGKTLRRPDGWDVDAIYLRVDLGGVYLGTAGLHVYANERYLGVLGRESSSDRVNTDGVPSWSIRVPAAILAQEPRLRAELHPTTVDPRLTVAGHRDALIDGVTNFPSAIGGSRFFDGTRWRSDLLTAPGTPPGNGTFRVWLLRSWGERI